MPALSAHVSLLGEVQRIKIYAVNSYFPINETWLWMANPEYDLSNNRNFYTTHRKNIQNKAVLDTQATDHTQQVGVPLLGSDF
jgi:hypothetical protein